MANLISHDGLGRRIEIAAIGSGSDNDPYILSVGVDSGFTNSKSSNATLSNVSSSASNGTLLSQNTDRIGVLIFNDSTSILYLKYGATASVSSYSVRMESGSYWEMPQPIFTGQIDGIWASANGAARVTELEV